MAYCCISNVTSTSTTGWSHILSTIGWSERENSAAPRREEREDAAAPLRGNEPDTVSLSRVDRLLCAGQNVKRQYVACGVCNDASLVMRVAAMRHSRRENK